MVSPELIRRYAFFAGLNNGYITNLSKVAEEVHVEAGRIFFHQGDDLNKFYLVAEGSVAIVIGITDRDYEHKIADQLTGNFNMKGITVSTVGIGEIFGWSALVPPHNSTAGAKAITPCRVVAFDCERLRPMFEKDCQFGYLMLLKAAQVIRGRLRDRRIESLSEFVG